MDTKTVSPVDFFRIDQRDALSHHPGGFQRFTRSSRGCDSYLLASSAIEMLASSWRSTDLGSVDPSAIRPILEKLLSLT